MVLYCCREHQIADFETNHKVLCKEYKKATEKLTMEEDKLHSDENGDPFEDSVGHFWGLHETRPYMRARYGVVQVLERMGSGNSLKAAADHLLDQLRLCRGDNMGLRDILPGILLRNGKEQECYDFVKWYSCHPTCSPSSNILK
jgi:hypothetical protein